MVQETQVNIDTKDTQPGWRDLRQWLELVDDLGELQRVSGANSEEDIGAITEMLEHHPGSPAAFFDDIPGFEPGYRVLSNGMGTKLRQAVTLGLDPAAATHENLLALWRGKLRSFTPVPPITVSDGPVLQNIHRNDEVDLTKFPAPVWHPKDGGRYIGTASVNIMRDPDTGILNAGTYRNQVFGRNTVGARVAPPHHGGIIKEKWFERGDMCPIVIVVGPDPLLFMAACVEGMQLGESELDWAGGVRGAGIEVIEGEITGLPIPAHAEIALEGFITNEFHKEGPYGEWLGYYQDATEKERVVRIERVYHRTDPIILGCPQGKPPHEDNQFLAYLRSGLIWDQLERAGVPGVTDVWAPPEGGNRLMTVVSLDTQYQGHAKQAGLIASQCSAAVEMNKLTIVVDDYVDVTSLQDVMWAVLTRSDPERSVDIIGRTKGNRLDMGIGPHDRDNKVNSRMVIDATTPFEWKNDPLAGDIICTPERTQATLQKWEHLLA